MRKKIVWGMLLLAFLLCLTACKDDSGDVTNTPSSSPTQGEDKEDSYFSTKLSGFGERVYIAPGQEMGYKSITENGVFFIEKKMVYYTPIGENGSEKTVALCSKPSCLHMASREEAGVPVTCAAECPAQTGVPFCDNGYVYVLTNVNTQEATGLQVSRRLLEGETWEEVTFISGYLLGGPPSVVGYQFVENGKAYLTVFQVQNLETPAGILQNMLFGVLELDLSTGEYRMLFEPVEEMYQNVYYINLVENTFIYSYVSAPMSLLDEICKLDPEATDFVQQIEDLLPDLATQKVVTIDMKTLEKTEIVNLPLSPISLEEAEAAETYFVDTFPGGAVYVENAGLYLKKWDGETAKLCDLEIDNVVRSNRMTGKLFITENQYTLDGVLNFRRAYWLAEDGTFTDTGKWELPVLIQLSLENGFTVAQILSSPMVDATLPFCLVREDNIDLGQVPSVVYYTANTSALQ